MVRGSTVDFLFSNLVVIDLIENDMTVWEKFPLENLAINDNLSYYKHQSFWQPVDTLRDLNTLRKYWDDGNAPWKLW